MAYSGTDLADMDPGESRAVTLTFTLVGGETISTVTWGIASIGALDPYAASHLGAGTLSGAIASNRVSGLIGGIKYLIQAEATTSSGNIYSLYTHVMCRIPT